MTEQTVQIASALATADVQAEVEDAERPYRIRLMVEFREAGGMAKLPMDRLVSAVRNAIVHEGLFAKRLLDSGIQLGMDDFIQIMEEAISASRGSSLRADPDSQFTDEESAELARGGFESVEPVPEGLDPVAQTAGAYVELLTSASTTQDAAIRLGVEESRIRQRLQARSLYGIKLGRTWRLPQFQFTDIGTVPGVDVVVSRLPSDLHPVAVWRWMTSTSPELFIDDALVSPREWLLSGGDPERAAELAAAL